MVRFPATTTECVEQPIDHKKDPKKALEAYLQDRLQWHADDIWRMSSNIIYNAETLRGVASEKVIEAIQGLAKDIAIEIAPYTSEHLC